MAIILAPAFCFRDPLTKYRPKGGGPRARRLWDGAKAGGLPDDGMGWLPKGLKKGLQRGAAKKLFKGLAASQQPGGGRAGRTAKGGYEEIPTDDEGSGPDEVSVSAGAGSGVGAGSAPVPSSAAKAGAAAEGAVSPRAAAAAAAAAAADVDSAKGGSRAPVSTAAVQRRKGAYTSLPAEDASL